MINNLHIIDRSVRLPLAIISIYYGFLESETIGNDMVAAAIGAFGLINLVATVSGYCPIYHITNIDTRKKQQED